MLEIPLHADHQWPLIPRQGDNSLQRSKSVIRAYVTCTYRKAICFVLPFCININSILGQFTNNNSAVVPWTVLSRDVNFEYISSESLPVGVFLLDPSKLQLVQIRQIWRHWTNRQEADTQGLVFLKALERDIREVDSAEGPSRDRSYKYVKPSELGPMDDFPDLNGLEKCPHLESPAAHTTSKSTKITFLQSLSKDPIYTKFVDLLISKDNVSFILLLSKLYLKTLCSSRMERLASP